MAILTIPLAYQQRNFVGKCYRNTKGHVATKS